MKTSEELPPPELDISTEKVCYIIVKAREFDEGRAVGDGPRVEPHRRQ